jgi:tetratricopeptide (TPR) repeat protein
MTDFKIDDQSAKTLANVGRDAYFGVVPGPPPPAPRQISPPPADFIGRTKEIDELLALAKADGQGVTIAGLRGMGGIGKTALAYVLADRLKERYPDAQFYLDLKGTAKPGDAGNRPIDPAEAMAHVVRGFRPDYKTPESLDQAHGDYLSVLADKRALLLMDNARDADQVRDLIPPSSCFLLVTSRERFHLPGLEARDLDCLSPDEARDLLTNNCKRIGEAEADKIAELCGYLPQALEVAAAALAEHVDLDLNDYIRRLETKKGSRFSEVDASLDLSHALLPEARRRVFRRLAVFPGGFAAAAAVAVAGEGLSASQARDELSALVKASMVRHDMEAKRYSLHDLVRVYADSRQSNTEREASGRRHAEYYRGVLAKANNMFLNKEPIAGLALFDREWENIREGQAWAAKRAPRAIDAARLCQAYADAGADCLDLRLHPRQRIQWLDAALASARKIGDRRGEGAGLGNLGRAYADLGETRRAIEHFEQALVIHREIGDRRGEGIALGHLGIAYGHLGETRRAIEHYEKALAIDREIGDRRGEGADLGNLGLAYADLGEARRAIELYEQALVIDREIGDRRGEGTDLINMSRALEKLDERERAIQCTREALAIFEQIESPTAEKARRLLALLQGG